jgi:hypothetical protein
MIYSMRDGFSFGSIFRHLHRSQKLSIRRVKERFHPMVHGLVALPRQRLPVSIAGDCQLSLQRVTLGYQELVQSMSV